MATVSTALATDEAICAERDNSCLYITFEIGDELYGIEIQHVQEITGVMNITRVPNLSPCLKGVVNLRGKIVPVVDVRARFDMPSHEYTDATSIIIVQITVDGRQIIAGIIVDSVSEVRQISPNQMQPRPEFGGDLGTDLIVSVGKLDDNIVQILDLNVMLFHGQFCNRKG